MIAMRQILLGPRGAPVGPTARDYVQNGLVAMWDGIENAGWGTHDAAATTWVDLTGNGHDATFVGNYEIESDALSFWDGGYALVNPGWQFGGTHTQEFAIKEITSLGVGRIIGENRGLEVRNSVRGFYGFGGDFGLTNDGFPVVPFSAAVVINTELASSERLYYYENGVVMANPSTFLGASAVDTPITFANRQSGARSVNMKFHCIRLYSRPLTAAEIAANYAIDKARFNLP